ncbi:MAG TPA: DUF4258 domain-containing protein [Tepidisphaeraceae bacterium]
MSRLWQAIRDAIVEERYLISFHADERCEERGMSSWQLAAEVEAAELWRERPSSQPHASVILRQALASGEAVFAIWAWLPIESKALLVTVYFETPDDA